MLHMKQNSYKLEIVGELTNKKVHLRALSRKLKVNPMTLSRKIKSLIEENVLDFKEEGKNKIYFLKKTSEAKANIFMAEQYKLTQLLKRYPKLRSIFENIQKNKKINLAILFGLYAKGIAKKNSDIDIYIEGSNIKLKKEIEDLNMKLNVKIGKYNKNNLLIKEIEKNHVIIKGVERFYGNF